MKIRSKILSDQRSSSKYESNSLKYIQLGISIVALILLGIFLIRPSIITAVKLGKKISDYKKIDKQLDEKIKVMQEIQSLYATYGKTIALSEAAVPKEPQEDKLLRQIQNLATKNGVLIKKIDYTYSKENELGTVLVNFSADGTYNNLNMLFDDISNMLRIVNIEKISLKPTELTEFTKIVSTEVVAKSYYQIK